MQYIAVLSHVHLGGEMPATKTATLSFRIAPEVKEGLRVAARQEHRSISNLVEVLIRGHCRRKGIHIPDQDALFHATGED